MDNFFKECPPMMSDGRFTTDYRTPTRREQYNQIKNNILDNNDYRLYLQTNADGIMSDTFEHLRSTSSCFPNSCIHKCPTRSNMLLDLAEMDTYNAVRGGNGKQRYSVNCGKLQDYSAVLVA